MPRTVLIGLDGATFTLLDPLMKSGVMPFLRQFVASGVRAGLTSVIPPLTPPAWTSLTTGRNPGQHGIFDFFCKEGPDSHYFRFANAHDIHADSVWEIANRHGVAATVLNFPLMFPPPAIDKHVVSGFIPWRQLRLGCYPSSLYSRLQKIPGFNPRELAMDMDLEAKALEGCGIDEYEAWIELHIRREQNWLHVLQELSHDDPAGLIAVLFDGPDKIQHLCWRFIDPTLVNARTLPPREQRIRERCLTYYRSLDELIAEIVRLAGTDATVVLASDHGFGAQEGTFFVNTWLEQQGLLRWAEREKSEGSTPQELGIGQLARHVYQLDWEQTRAYAPTPSGNAIYIVRQSAENPRGVPEAEIPALRAALVEQLAEIKDPASGEAVVTRVWLREEVFRGPFEELAPDLTLQLRDGGQVSIVASDTVYRERPEPSGTHRRTGIFMAAGPGIAGGVALPDLSILDIAPLLLYSLNIPVPQELEGAVPRRAYTPAYIEEHPLEVAATQPPKTGKPRQAAPRPMRDAAMDAELMKRLRALGYVE